MRDAVEETGQGEFVERMDVALHDLCQPLTVLQCRLSMGQLIGEPEAMREAIREALQECVRLNKTVGTMRGLLQRMMLDEENQRLR